MNEQELREKIIEILRTSGYGYFITHDNADTEQALEDAAKALIENGIGDVAEWKEKVEQATSREKFEETERKYADKRENGCRNRIKVIEQERDEWKRRAEVAETKIKQYKLALLNACAMLYAQGVESPFSDDEWHLRIAEREIEEEKSNGEKKKV